jgi:flagellar basal-body rod protein FlgG
MVTSDGYTLWPEITIPREATSVSIGAQGAVAAKIDGETESRKLGDLKLVNFQNPAGLVNMGRNLMVQSASSGDPTEDTPGVNGLGTISQGFLEMSNVKVVEEMVNLIVAQRAYEVNSKSIQTADEMLSIANQLRR